MFGVLSMHRNQLRSAPPPRCSQVRLGGGHYDTLNEVTADVALVWDNQGFREG